MYPKLTIKNNKNEIDESRLVEVEKTCSEPFNIDGSGTKIGVAYGQLGNHAIALSCDYEWVLGKDDTGMIVVVPLKKIGR